MNMHDWLKRIIQDYISKQVIEDRMSLNKIKEKFYIDLHDIFFCMVPTLLHKFLLDKGVNDIFKYRPRLGTPLPNRNF
jgi:hypothetical protein